jgi:hypothetical protein
LGLSPSTRRFESVLTLIPRYSAASGELSFRWCSVECMPLPLAERQEAARQREDKQQMSVDAAGNGLFIGRKLRRGGRHMAGNSLLDRFRIFRRPIIVGACAITARRRSGAAIPIAGTVGARSDGSAAAAVLALAALMKDRRDEENGALSPIGRIQRLGSQSAFCQRCGAWRSSLGLEPNYRLYVEHLIGVLREVRRVLQPDGTCGSSSATAIRGRSVRS